MSLLAVMVVVFDFVEDVYSLMASARASITVDAVALPAEQSADEAPRCMIPPNVKRAAKRIHTSRSAPRGEPRRVLQLRVLRSRPGF